MICAVEIAVDNVFPDTGPLITIIRIYLILILLLFFFFFC